MLKSYLILIALVFFLAGCNKNLTEEEKKALWDNAQTQGEIIRRSGTPFNLATNPDLAMSDAQNRLLTGGGLLGKKANFNFLGEKNGPFHPKMVIFGPYLSSKIIQKISKKAIIHEGLIEL